MHTRFRVASVVALSLLFATGVGRAQQADSLTAADSIATKGPLPGRGGIGGQIGGTYMVAGGADYPEGAQPRFSFTGHFRYVMNRRWGWQMSPSFAWNGYVSHADAPFADPNFPTEGVSKQFYLTQLVGVSAQLQWFAGTGRTRWHLGAGPAVYRVVIQNHRKVIEDPVTRETHDDMHLGATAELGVERFLQKLPNTSLELTAGWKIAYARDDTKFPSGWNGNPQMVDLRFGAHYYYDFRKPKPKSTRPGLN